MFQVYDAPKHWCTLFTRVAYVTSAHPQLVLISYSGDASVAASFPHGNARQSNREYVRTQPHVLADIRSKAGSARNVYQTLVLNGPADVQQQTTATPRNIEQVRNVQKSQRNLSRLTHDALYNLHEFAADSDFVHRIVTHPDLSVIMYSPDIVSLFQTLLASDSHSAVHVLSYDTTFCLGDFYLSPLLFRNADFDPAPAIPLAYLLHERKTTDTHTDFFRHLRTVVPELLTCPKLIIVAAVVAADDDVEPMGEQAVTIRQDICHACDSAEPPPRKNRRQREIHWIKCDDCPRWFHIICVGVRNTTAAYTCDLCA